ncbi:hypothetical protein AQUCO_02300003v1 [Aquilegia coerulea]|uniref:Myb/SANT-like domain-containing protein n=1 Tax=Aquilegia coerulea TaxID=218851 RepID=A0A2G5DBL2_AQUCA|nr:hypothetical protein AQUCO_02300003v1 [Aquilegia coerulea]
MAGKGKSPICDKSTKSPSSKKCKSPKKKKSKSPKSKNSKGKQFRWSQEKDKVMIQILLEEHIDGQKTENGFSSTTYQKVCKALNEAQNLDMEMDATIEHVRNRYRTFKSTYRKARKIHKSDSGFGWNPRTERLTADPLVWEAFFEKQSETERKEYEKFRTKVMPFYDDLVVIVGDEDEATGEGGLTGIETDEQMPSIEDTGMINI